MADPVPQSGSLRVVGRLCSGPADLGAAFPHGGTDLGAVVAVDFFPEIVAADIEDESISQERTETLLMCERAHLQAVMGSMTAAMAALVHAHTTGGGGGYGKTGDDGRKASAGEVVLLFSPRTTTHKGILMYRACPSWADGARLQHSLDSDLGAAVVFRGIRHATKGVYDQAVLSELTL